MTREEYTAKADELIREFAKVYDPTGPADGHHTEAQKAASAAITGHATYWRDEWFPPTRMGGKS